MQCSGKILTKCLKNQKELVENVGGKFWKSNGIFREYLGNVFEFRHYWIKNSGTAI